MRSGNQYLSLLLGETLAKFPLQMRMKLPEMQ
jgi:hypothetical protein